MKQLGPYLHNVKAVFVGHEHGDHLKAPTIKRIHELRPTVRFMAGNFLKDRLTDIGINRANIDVLGAGKVYDYKMFKVSPFILFHDVKNYGLRIFDKGKKVLYATDTKSINHITAKGYNLFLLEGNYSEKKISENLKNAKDSWEIYYCQRAQETHLSIEQASDFLMDNMDGNSHYRLIHTSKNNA